MLEVGDQPSKISKPEGSAWLGAAKAVKARLKEIGRDPDYADERQALEGYAMLQLLGAHCGWPRSFVRRRG